MICNSNAPRDGGNTSRSRFAFTKRLCLASSIPLKSFSPIPYNEHTNAKHYRRYVLIRLFSYEHKSFIFYCSVVLHLQSNKTNKNIVCANSQLIDNKERATKMLLTAINKKYKCILLSYLLETFSEVKLVYVPVFGALYLPSAMFLDRSLRNYVPCCCSST